MARSHEPKPQEVPAWFGLRYPTQDDLETYAWELGAVVVYGDVEKGAFFPASSSSARAADVSESRPAVIIVPRSGPLARAWSLAHELGHLVHHSGPKGELLWSKGEAQANRWAACALIPEARILLHQNACVDAFVGALSAHFEDLPLQDCASRRLAGRIARMRINALEKVA
nr:ImmA/IrrE family metallo-endopeptidase [uncultured Holophaga sp.]